MKRRFARAMLYLGPILLCLVGLGYLSTDVATYQASLKFFYRMVYVLSPEYSEFREQFNTSQRIEQTVIIYPIIGTLRKLAHIFCYGLLSLLIARAVQSGRETLRWQTPVVVVFLAIVVTGLESWVRLKFSTQRHVRWEQLWLNLAGAGFALLSTLIFFGIKSLERRIRATE
jgi:VanZ family protein